ncbi:uncharacterized protein LOC126378006 [Pectinophora gossypiella]|uniref:uncharacterized protein LOC126378006 n=1 Tax=Pectinophora gossypiella TaxID=13191 RepID=UPI00214E4E97|nr:uncharacterized protein LOC126378006 [Pectinophora gossypiella]
MTLFNHEVQTHPVTQAAYPWIAAVVHTTTGVLPFVCTASLIEKGIFITAARCIYKLKIVQTRVLYKDTKLTVKVFVIPSPPTKQMFDDVGLIVVTDENFKGAWTPVKLFSGKRTDNEFDWFFKLRTQRTSDHKVVGYAHAKHTYDAILPPATPTRLTELPVTVGIAMCKQIFANIKINGFYVPCYSGCTIAEFIKHDPKCERYHGSLGGAVYNFKTKELLGVATWGAANSRRTLPVGFAVPNSDNFKKDLACARKINIFDKIARTLPEEVILNQKSMVKVIPNYDEPTMLDNDIDQDAVVLGARLEDDQQSTTTTKSNNKNVPQIIKHVNQSIFPALDNYHDGASLISETKYPWIARIVHSKSADYPFICTASCIDNQIFITAARCIPMLKIEFTSVIYKKQRFHPIAFLIPSSPTKQMYDDIGIIVVDGREFDRKKRHWVIVKLFEGNRTDTTYQWLAELQLYKSMQHVAIGYASHKNFAKVHTARTRFQLYEMKVHVGITLCTVYGRKIGYYVPCYHACDLTKPSDPKCKKYLGTEGAALFNFKSNKLLGVATWGGKKVTELPVGFSVPNSENFFQDLDCARKIRADLLTTRNPPKDHYKKLCRKL